MVEWVDLFTRPEHKEIIINNFKFYREQKGLSVHAYVIMSNHVHCILSATVPKYDLSSIIQNFKSFTSRQLYEAVDSDAESRNWWMKRLFERAASKHTRNHNYQIWTHENHPIELFSPDFIQQRLNYIHDNPVQAGIVDEPEEYIYSSARNYANSGKLCRLGVDCIDEFVQDRKS